MVLVRGVLFEREHHHARRHEACDVVHMPMRVVADAALAEPDRLADPQFLGEAALVVGAREAGVPHLHVAQQPLLGHEHRALAVGLDAAPLEHHASLAIVPRRLVQREPGVLGDERADSRVGSEVVVLRPRIEAPVHEAHTAIGDVHARRAGIAQPDAVARALMQVHTRLSDLVHAEAVPRLFLGRVVVHEDAHLLVLGECPRDLGVDPRDRRELARPVRLVVRPRDPGGVVTLPLSGPANTRAHDPIQRLRIGPYASTRRSRRNGQLRRVYSISAGSHVAISVASPVSACAM